MLEVLGYYFVVAEWPTGWFDRGLGWVGSWVHKLPESGLGDEFGRVSWIALDWFDKTKSKGNKCPFNQCFFYIR